VAKGAILNRISSAHHAAVMRSSDTSTSLTPRNENSSLTRYIAGFSEVCLTMLPTAAVTAA